MKQFLRCLFALVFVASLPSLLTAQSSAVRVEATVTDSTYLIGQYIPLQLQVAHDKNIEVEWPFLVDSIGAFEIIKSGKIDTVIEEGFASERQEIILMKFDSGDYVIPTIPFRFTENGKKQVVNTKPVYLRVNTVAVDTTAAIMPIKPIMQVPWTLKEAMPYIVAGVIGLFLLALLLFVYFRYLRNKSGSKEEAIILEPHELAAKRLEELRAKKLWQSGEVKGYYSELTEILREYIDGRFEVPALEMTTDEIGSHIKKKKEVTKGLYRNTIDLLTISDFVKFAKANPSTKYHPDAFKHVMEFVEQTKLEKVEEELES